MTIESKLSACQKSFRGIAFDFVEPADGYVFLRARFTVLGQPHELTEPVSERQTAEVARANLVEQVHQLIPLSDPQKPR